MTDHPITPPPELVREWAKTCSPYDVPADHIATQAARWGADTELEACCEWLVHNYNYPEAGNPLRSARRPKPPSLKEQALDALGPEPLPERGPTGDTILNVGTIQRHRLIRRALEQLDD